MRITRSLFLSALFTLIVGTVSANTSPEKTSTRYEIKNLIQKANLASEIENDLTVHVTFMVNEKNEIIIMSTDKDQLDKMIKYTLNYKKLKSTDMQVNKVYTLPISLKKK